MRKIPRILLLSLLGLLSLSWQNILGQNTVVVTAGTAPAFDTVKLKSYLENPDFQYQRRAPSTSLIQRLWNDFLHYLESLFSEGSGITKRFLVILLIAGAIVVLAYFFMRSRFQFLFAKGDKKMRSSIRILNEDVRISSLKEHISNALHAGDYRTAYRWTYINLLRHLHQSGLLRLHGDKTNRDYIQEMKSTPVHADFLVLAEAFDFTWYGDYPIDRLTFDQYQGVSERILHQITQG